MITYLDEAQVEITFLSWFHELGYGVLFGPDIAFDGERPERASCGDVVLVGRLTAVVPHAVLEE